MLSHVTLFDLLSYGVSCDGIPQFLDKYFLHPIQTSIKDMLMSPLYNISLELLWNHYFLLISYKCHTLVPDDNLHKVLVNGTKQMKKAPILRCTFLHRHFIKKQINNPNTPIFHSIEYWYDLKISMLTEKREPPFCLFLVWVRP